MNTNDRSEGLPAVGVICEGYTVDGNQAYAWHRVEVLKRTDRECAVYLIGKGLLRWCDEFRPLMDVRERREFERFILENSAQNHSDLSRSGSQYDSVSVELAWQAWYLRAGLGFIDAHD